MTQAEQVIEALRRNGGYATLGQLYQLVDFSTWGTKTPQSSVRRIVQQTGGIFKIKAGLWALEDFRDSLPEHILPNADTPEQKLRDDNHSHYQGILVEMGNILGFTTYIPAQDKNKPYTDKRLIDVVSTMQCPTFSYPEIVRRAISVDVIWFNERMMPTAMYEVENTTDIQNSLGKFVDLQDFYTDFFIVADESKKNQFEDRYNFGAFSSLKSNRRVSFLDYDRVSERYAAEVASNKLGW